jgi:hypothetical protein
MAAQVFERIFGHEADIDFLKAFTDYSKGLAKFSDERMLLAMMADMYASEVSFVKLSIMSVSVLRICRTHHLTLYLSGVTSIPTA